MNLVSCNWGLKFEAIQSVLKSVLVGIFTMNFVSIAKK